MREYFKLRFRSAPGDYAWTWQAGESRTEGHLVKVTSGRLLCRFAFPLKIKERLAYDIMHGDTTSGKHISGKVVEVWWIRGLRIKMYPWHSYLA